MILVPYIFDKQVCLRRLRPIYRRPSHCRRCPGVDLFSLVPGCESYLWHQHSPTTPIGEIWMSCDCDQGVISRINLLFRPVESLAPCSFGWFHFRPILGFVSLPSLCRWSLEESNQRCSWPFFLKRPFDLC